jgi:hypothetical protein
MQTEIAYDRRERGYQLIDRNGVELGRYRGRREAVEAQLALEAPGALDLAKRATTRHPALASRALRAAQLVAAGKVHLDTACHQVESQTGAGEYCVEWVGGIWRCSCPDWQGSITGEPFRAPWVGTGPKCKHVLAVLMAIKLEEGRGKTGGGDGNTSSANHRSLWDQQQAIVRFQEYLRRVDEEGADPSLLFTLALMM